MIQPILTKAAAELLSEAYIEFRQKRELQNLEAEALEDAYANRFGASGKSTSNTFPVTARTLETLIRLASAHAKARLSGRVERRDAKVAIELINYCLWKEVLPKKKKQSKRARTLAADSSSSEDESRKWASRRTR